MRKWLFQRGVGVDVHPLHIFDVPKNLQLLLGTCLVFKTHRRRIALGRQFGQTFGRRLCGLQGLTGLPQGRDQKKQDQNTPNTQRQNVVELVPHGDM